MIRLSIFKSIYLFALFYFYIDCSNHTNYTCEQASTCIMNVVGSNPTSYISNCLDLNKDCDRSCLSLMKNYQICTKNCLCFKPDQEFQWECIDNCKNLTESESFKSLIDCIYKPCKNPDENTSERSEEKQVEESSKIIPIKGDKENEPNNNDSNFFLSFIWVILVVLFLVIALYAFKKWKSYKLEKQGNLDYEIPGNHSYTY